tara:strand:- start:612 stop:737 length:126 start_codon:yes stop_codon:yes gene_type:complete
LENDVASRSLLRNENRDEESEELDEEKKEDLLTEDGEILHH